MNLLPSRVGASSSYDSWIPEDDSKRTFLVGNKDVANTENSFDIVKARENEKTGSPGSAGERSKTRALFTATKWNWILEVGDEPVGWRRPTYRHVP